MIQITFFLCRQMLATSVALPMEQFRAAISMSLATRPKQHQEINIRLASIDGKPVQTHTGMTLTPDCAISDIEHSDITYLPALWRNPKPVLRENVEIQQWMMNQHKQGHTIAGVGTGCCFMAEAGLLDFQPATTHWYYFDEFARLYPRVQLKRQHFITQADNLYCTGSVTSLADLTIFFIQGMFGRNIARLVERHFFHEVRQAYSLPNLAKGEAPSHPDEDIAQAQSWMRHNAHQDIRVTAIADQLRMSLRTFNRRFKNATALTPLQYLQRIRLGNAGELLQTSNLTVAEIAHKCGYQDLAHFSALFKTHFGTTPSQYRTTVRAKLFQAD